MASMIRPISATIAATATGTKLRGVHSNSNSSIASMIAAIGVPNTVVIPGAAPATSSVLRSLSLTGSACAISEPIAPPVMMIGPSAPNGPPVPIAIADEIGLRIATLMSSRERPSMIASIASGDAVAPDLVAAIACHQPYDQRADHWHQHRGKRKAVIAEIEIGETELPKVSEIGAKADQPKERHPREQCRHRHDCGNQRNDEDARLGGEVS